MPQTWNVAHNRSGQHGYAGGARATEHLQTVTRIGRLSSLSLEDDGVDAKRGRWLLLGCGDSEAVKTVIGPSLDNSGNLSQGCRARLRKEQVSRFPS